MTERRKKSPGRLFKIGAGVIGVGAILLTPQTHWVYWLVVALTIVLAVIGFALAALAKWRTS